MTNETRLRQTQMHGTYWKKDEYDVESIEHQESATSH